MFINSLNLIGGWATLCYLNQTIWNVGYTKKCLLLTCRRPSGIAWTITTTRTPHFWPNDFVPKVNFYRIYSFLHILINSSMICIYSRQRRKLIHTSDMLLSIESDPSSFLGVAGERQQVATMSFFVGQVCVRTEEIRHGRSGVDQRKLYRTSPSRRHLPWLWWGGLLRIAADRQSMYTHWTTWNSSRSASKSAETKSVPVAVVCRSLRPWPQTWSPTDIPIHQQRHIRNVPGKQSQFVRGRQQCCQPHT